MVFSQGEIEQVGLEARARLGIIDGFSHVDADSGRIENNLTATIKSHTVQLRQLSRDLEATQEQIALLATVPEELAAAVDVQNAVLQTIHESEKQQTGLEKLNAALTAGAVRTKQVEQARVDVEGWRTRVRAVLRQPPHLGDWPAAAGTEDLLSPVRSSLSQIVLLFDHGLAELDKVVNQLDRVFATSQATTLAVEDEARKLRRELEKLKDGAGVVAQRVSALQEKAGQLEALRSRVQNLSRRIEDVQGQRGEVLAELQGVRDKRYEFRSQVAQALTDELGPSVEVAVEQGGDTPAYVAAIQASIRGSGLHHASLSPQLAQSMSPRELAEAVEKGDARTIARLTGIDEERAAKVILAVRSNGTEGVITAPIHDRVVMKLLVGNEYKPTTELSTGQRCTVILSVLLGFQGRGLLIDQPEDNLDNAFIVGTLVEAIRRQKSQTQLILTTHNPNIPVLGDAEAVILLGSDGQRGFKVEDGPVTKKEIVRAITTVMEGGHKAFERRAKFYREWLGSADDTP
jgi:prefoldin subunit 5